MPHSSIKLYKKSTNNESFVIVYYQHQEPVLRYRTGVKVKKAHFSEKSGLVKKTDPDASAKNKKIADAQANVEGLIEEYDKEFGVLPTSKFIDGQLKDGIQAKREKAEADLLDCFQDFVRDKAVEFATPERSMASLRDYKSTGNALRDFEQVNGTILTPHLNTKSWLDKFNTFLSKPRPKIAGYRFITKRQNDKTRHKRLSILKSFGQYLVDNGYLSNIDALLKYKIEVKKKIYYTLSLAEVELLGRQKFKSKPHQTAVDMFLVACHTGLRFSDLIQITKFMVRDITNGQVLRLSTQKTKEQIEVPLTPIAKQILQRYDYSFVKSRIGKPKPLLSSQKANYYLHDALKSLDTFREEYEYGTGGYGKPKYELITFHTGRRTFITELVNDTISLNAIMKMTGHRKIQTLEQYINPDYDIMMENVAPFAKL